MVQTVGRATCQKQLSHVKYVCQSHLTIEALPEITLHLTVTEIKVHPIGLNEQHKGADC